jgi:hypothetical protein
MTGYMLPKSSEPNPPSPARRTWRTVVQVAVAVCVAVPAAVAALPVSPVVAAWVVGITGAFVILATAAVNAFDKVSGRG